MIVKNPCIHQKVKEEVIEMPLTNSLHDFILRGFLKQVYTNFKMCNGFFSKYNRTELRERLNAFIPLFLQNLDFFKLALFDSLSGMDIAMISTPAALFVQSVIAQLQSDYAFISHVVIFNKKALVYSELNVEDTHALWVQLFGSLFNRDSLLFYNNNNRAGVNQSKVNVFSGSGVLAGGGKGSVVDISSAGKGKGKAAAAASFPSTPSSPATSFFFTPSPYVILPYLSKIDPNIGFLPPLVKAPQPPPPLNISPLVVSSTTSTTTVASSPSDSASLPSSATSPSSFSTSSSPSCPSASFTSPTPTSAPTTTPSYFLPSAFSAFPSVYLSDNTTSIAHDFTHCIDQTFRVVTHKFCNVSIVLLIPNPTPYYTDISALENDLQSHSAALVPFLEQIRDTPFNNPIKCRYIYLNQIDLFIHSTLSPSDSSALSFSSSPLPTPPAADRNTDRNDSRGSEAVDLMDSSSGGNAHNLTFDLLSVVNEIHKELNHPIFPSKEVILKTVGDYWVCGKRTYERELVCVFADGGECPTVNHAGENLKNFFTKLTKPFI